MNVLRPGDIAVTTRRGGMGLWRDRTAKKRREWLHASTHVLVLAVVMQGSDGVALVHPWYLVLGPGSELGWTRWGLDLL